MIASLFNSTLLTSTVAEMTVTLHSAFTPFDALAVIVASPSATAVTTPFSSTVATFGSLDVHVIVLSVASAGFTVTVRAVYFSPSFRLIASLFNTTSSTATFTVTSHSAVFPFDVVAVIVVVPLDTAVTTPLFTVAMLVSPDVHSTFLSVALSGVIVAVI